MKRPISQAGILVIIGIIGLTFVTRNPRFAAFHAVDVLQLLASGACFGVAIALLFGSRGQRTQ